MGEVLPVIDLSQDIEYAARQLLNAATSSGFFYVTHHGFKQDEVDAIFSLSRKFFALPYGEKHNFEINTANRGYTALNREVLDDSVPEGDLKEAFNFGQFLHGKPTQALPPIFQDHLDLIRNFSVKCHDLCLRVLSAFGVALEIPEKDWFANRHGVNEPSGSILRLLQYTSNSGGAASHTDYGSLTLLFQRHGQDGLQVFSGNEWVPAKALPSSVSGEAPPILINIADQLTFWTAGLLTSTRHRVEHPKGAEGIRQSIAYFCHPADDTLLSPVPSNMVPQRENSTNETVLTAGEHLNRRLQHTYDWKP